MQPDDLDFGLEEGSDEDSIFVPFADLFTLLSLTVIYVVLTFGQMLPAAISEPVVAATLQGSGAGRPIDPAAVYVSLHGTAGAIQFRVVKGGTAFERSVTDAGAETRVPEQWLKETISRGTDPTTIYVYLPETEAGLMVRALFSDTQRFLSSTFSNVRTAL